MPEEQDRRDAPRRSWTGAAPRRWWTGADVGGHPASGVGMGCLVGAGHRCSDHPRLSALLAGPASSYVDLYLRSSYRHANGGSHSNIYPLVRSSYRHADRGSHSCADPRLGFAIHYETRKGPTADRRRCTGDTDSGAHQSGAIGGRSREAGSGAEPGLSGDSTQPPDGPESSDGCSTIT